MLPPNGDNMLLLGPGPSALDHEDAYNSGEDTEYQTPGDRGDKDAAGMSVIVSPRSRATTSQSHFAPPRIQTYSAPLSPSSAPVMVHLVGQGTQGALALDPPSLDLGTIMVGTPVTRTLTLLNQSDGVLRYSLEVGATASEDGPVESGAAPIEFASAGLAGGGTPPPGAAGGSSSPVEFWVEEPEGALPARASKTITFTLFPRYRKTYKLQVRCRTSTVAPLNVGGSGAAGPGGAGAGGGREGGSRPPSGSSATLKPLGPPKSAAAASSSSPHEPPPAVCPVTATTTFPTVLITDAFSEGVPKQVLWDLLGVKDVNRELRSNVTPLELELNRMEDRGQLTTASAMRSLDPYVLQFGTHAHGERNVVVHLELTNYTALQAHWELHRCVCMCVCVCVCVCVVWGGDSHTCNLVCHSHALSCTQTHKHAYTHPPPAFPSATMTLTLISPAPIFPPQLR